MLNEDKQTADNEFDGPSENSQDEQLEIEYE